MDVAEDPSIQQSKADAAQVNVDVNSRMCVVTLNSMFSPCGCECMRTRAQCVLRPNILDVDALV